MTTREFVEEAKKVFGDLYDYSESGWVGCRIPISIRCKKHGIFTKVGSKHLSGDGCTTCRREDAFIKRSKSLYGDMFDYSGVVWVSSKDHVELRCKIHGVMYQTPAIHYICGCRQCKYQKIFLERAKAKFGDYYDYSKVDYVKHNQKVIIICPVHGEFEQSPEMHISGNGCSRCTRSEIEILRHADGKFKNKTENQ